MTALHIHAAARPDTDAIALPAGNAAALATIAAELERISFGSVQISIREGQIVELEISEKQRFS